MADLFDLRGKTALITGGGRGLGREMTEAFAEHGADVIIASRKLDLLEQAATEIADSTGRRITPKQCHVGDWDALGALVDDVYAEFGRIDVLVNNAGMSPLYESPSAVTEDLWRKVLDVNLTGPWRLSALVGERMKADGSGAIINVSSTASITPTAAELPYGAAKAGINNLTAGLAQTLAPQVRVNCLMPGPFATDISKAWHPGVFEHFTTAVALQRAGEPHEIVGAALLLASDAGAYITGSIIRLDGGMSGVVGNG